MLRYLARAVALGAVAAAQATTQAAAQGAGAQTTLEVKPDRQNVVASRLAGEWEPDAALTVRLGGTALAGAAPGADTRVGGRIVIRSDPAVAGKVPGTMAAAMLRQVPALQVFLAGTLTLGGKDFPFVLISASGNSQLLYFRERGGDPFGDGESFIVALSPAKEPANDILFIGGDFNNQPFSAFKRVGPGAGGADGQARERQ